MTDDDRYDDEDDEDVLQVVALDVLPHTVKATCEGLIDAVKSAPHVHPIRSPRRSQLPSPGPASSRAHSEEHGASDAGRLRAQGSVEGVDGLRVEADSSPGPSPTGSMRS